jgi:hypothetical protein
MMLPQGCHYIRGNYGEVETLRTILSPECEVIDLAYSTVPKTSFEDPLYDLTSNLPSSVRLLQTVPSHTTRNQSPMTRTTRRPWRLSGPLPLCDVAGAARRLPCLGPP